MRFVTRAKMRAVIGSLLLLGILQALWIFSGPSSSPVLSKILQRYPLGQNAMVYVAESDEGGATVPATFHYYVFRDIADDDEALKALQGEGFPFLVTRDYESKVSVVGGRVHVSVKRRVYSFHTPANLRLNGEQIPIDIWLDAQIDYSKFRDF